MEKGNNGMEGYDRKTGYKLIIVKFDQNGINGDKRIIFSNLPGGNHGIYTDKRH